MSNVNELIERKESCVWLKKRVCKITDTKPCPDDCDLKELKFEKDEIIRKMKEEEQNVHKLKKDGIFKNRNTITITPTSQKRILGCSLLMFMVCIWNKN